MARRVPQRQKKNLEEIVKFVRNRLTGGVVSLSIKDETIEEEILDALSVVSQYKPKIISMTINAAGRRHGSIEVTDAFYPEDWKKGDEVPEAVLRQDVVTVIQVEPATSIRRYPASDNPFSFRLPTVFAEKDHFYYGLNAVSDFSSYYIDYKLVDYALSTIIQQEGQTFDWELDPNEKARVFYANLPSNVGELTLTIGLEHTLGYYDEDDQGEKIFIDDFFVPSPEEGVDLVKSKYQIQGNILQFTQDLALGKCMLIEGRVRRKLTGGSNTTQLDGDAMINDGQALIDEVMQKLTTNPDLSGWFSDYY